MSNVLKIAELTKVCSRCKIEKSRTEFAYSKKGDTGCVPRCKVCVNEVYRMAHPKNDRTKVLPSEATCSACRMLKPISEFSYKAQNVKKNGGHSYKCKPCDRVLKKQWRQEGRLNADLTAARTQRFMDSLKEFPEKMKRHKEAVAKSHKKYILSDKYLGRVYGISSGELKTAYESQHGLCANRACGKEIFIDVVRGNDRAFIDHCHNTGEFRALLCFHCNTLLGNLEKNKNQVLGLMDYSEKHTLRIREKLQFKHKRNTDFSL